MSQIHHTNRDYALDILRGICVISIVLIHTTFWSGGSYVPQAVQSLSLLIDVPAFFFIAGASQAYAKQINPLPSIWKMIAYFGVAIALYDIYAWIRTGELSFVATFSALTLHGFSTPLLPVLGGSYWFVPVFCVVGILGGIVLRYVRLRTGILAGLVGLGALLTYTYVYAGRAEFQGSFFGVGTQYLLFYTALFVLGFCFIKSSNRRAYSMTFILVGAIGFIATELFHKLGLPAGIPSLSNLQAHKFPPSLPYILASCFSLGLLLFFYQYLSKCNLAQILQQSRIVLARANNRGGGGEARAR